MKVEKSFWAYDKSSVLTNGFIKTINYVLLFCFSIIGFIPYGEIMGDHYYVIYIGMLVGIILNSYIVHNIRKNTYFYEWDYTERKKRDRFMMTVNNTSLIFSCSFGIVASLLVAEIYLGDFTLFFIVSKLVASVLFLFNAVKCTSLHHFLFESELTTAYKMQKKPPGWIEEGKEIEDADEIKEIMKRDFGIDL